MESLIVDRTEEDVNYAAANPGLAELKGAYNATDLNRIGAWANYLRGQVYMKTNWTIQDLVYESNWKTFFDGIKLLRSSLPVFPETPPAPNGFWDLIAPQGWERANDIERILADANDIKSVAPQLGTFQLGGILI